MNKQNYINAMDKITVSESFSARTAELMREARTAPPIKQFKFNYKYAAIAACAVLVVGVGAFMVNAGFTNTMKSAVPQASYDNAAAAETAAGVADENSNNGDRTTNEVNLVSPMEQADDSNAFTAGEKDGASSSDETTASKDMNISAETTSAATMEPSPSATTTVPDLDAVAGGVGDLEAGEGGIGEHMKYNIVFDGDVIAAGTKFINLRIDNKSNETIYIDMMYKLYKDVNGEWVWINEDMAFIEIVQEIPANSESNLFSGIDTSKLGVGIYAVEKTINGETHIASFRVTDDPNEIKKINENNGMPIENSVDTDKIGDTDEVVVAYTSTYTVVTPAPVNDSSTEFAGSLSETTIKQGTAGINMIITNRSKTLSGVVEIDRSIEKYENGKWTLCSECELAGSPPAEVVKPGGHVNININTKYLEKGRYRAINYAVNPDVEDIILEFTVE